MYKYILSVMMLGMLASCGNSGSGESTGSGTTTAQTADNSGLSDNPVYKKGLGLIAKSDCLTCHKVDEPLTGPKYRDVANKYASYSDTIVPHLAKKIIAGGTGVWGQIPMIPHPQITQEDAEAMVKYILLLKK